MMDFAKGLTNRKKKRQSAEPTSHETSSIDSTAATAASEDTGIQIAGPRRATMDSGPTTRPRGLPPQPRAPSPVTEITRNSNVGGTIVRTPSLQHINSNVEVTPRTITTSTVNTTTSTVVTTKESTRIVGNTDITAQGGINRHSVITETGVYPSVITEAGVQPSVITETGVHPAVTNVALESFLRYISNERKIRMPDRGSDWDRVLHAAQFFGLQVSEFGDRVDAFMKGQSLSADAHAIKTNGFSEHNNVFRGARIEVSSSKQKKIVSVNSATDLVSAALTASHTLLEIGHTQAKVLLPIFTALYEVSVLLTHITRIHNLEQPSEAIRRDAIHTFHDLVVLLNSIAALYQQKISDLQHGFAPHISIEACFGEKIEQIWRSKETLSDGIWKQKLEEADLSITVDQLRWKLQFPDNYCAANRKYDDVEDYSSPSAENRYWLKQILSDFLSGEDKLLCITGNGSSGKSFLAGWVEGRLARPLYVKSYHAIRYNFPHDAPNKATPTAFLKSILFRLLEQNINNVELYKSIALAFGKHDVAGVDAEPTESSLWKALHDCLGAIHVRQALIVLVLDGCDGIVGGDAAFYTELQKCISGHPHVRAVTFCRSVPEVAQKYECQMNISNVRKDIEIYFNASLSRSDLEPREREGISRDMAAKSDGNWLWAFYAARLLSQEQSKESIIKVSRNMGSNISDVLFKIVEMLQLETNHDLRTLFSIMLVVARPLTVVEFTQLLSVNLHKGFMSATPPDVNELISRSCCDLIVVKDGYVQFRTEAIRLFMKQRLRGFSLPSEEEAHRQLTLIMLLYAKLTLKEDREPSADILDYGHVFRLFSKHSLLGYVVQNWVEHFQASGFTGSEVSDKFPNSVMFALLERNCWTRFNEAEKLVSNHKLALHVRQACFGEQHVVVLHTLVTLGYIYRNVFGSSSDATWYFYKAVDLGKKILSKSSILVKDCMQSFFDFATTLEITNRTRILTRHNKEEIDIVAWFEEMTRLAIEIDRHEHGYSSDEVITGYEKLAKLYNDIREDNRVVDVYQELYAVIASRYGDKSDKAKRINIYFATLDIDLKGVSANKVGELEHMIYQVSEELKFTDFRCIERWIRLAQCYERCQDLSQHLFYAERLFASLWQRITAICDPKTDEHVHLIEIEIGLEYSKFLRKQSRIQECGSILICLWEDYKLYREYNGRASGTSDAAIKITMRIREVAEECRASGLASIAVSMLTNVWDSFNNNGNNEETQKTVVRLTEVVEEITETTVTEHTTVTTAITETTETVVKKFFNLLLGQHVKSNTDTAIFSACKALIGLYKQQENWREVETVLKNTLQVTWNEILTTDSKIGLSTHSIEECLDLARRLADCYSNQGLFKMAEKIHSQIFRACLELNLDADLPTRGTHLTGYEVLEEAINVVVEFYKKHYRYREVINIYKAILTKYRTELGEKHESTIRILYLLADIYEKLGLEDAYEYYKEIVTLLNNNIAFCHPDAFEAALALCRYYNAHQHWSELQKICIILWETIIRHRGEWIINGKPTITGEKISSVYGNYSRVLGMNAVAESSVLYKVASEYRDIVSETYRDEPLLIITALLALAEICETQSGRHEESVKIYDDVLEKITTVETTTTTKKDTITQTAKRNRSRVWVTMIKDSKTIRISLEDATEMARQYKANFRDQPEQTLRELEDILLLYQQVNSTESRRHMSELLEASVKSLVASAVVNVALFHAAVSLASLFVRAGLTARGKGILDEMSHSLVSEDKSTQTESQPVLNDSQKRKVLLIFLIAFKHGLDQNSGNLSYSKIMAEIGLESLLHAEYSRVSNEKAEAEIILERGAKLRHFWHIHQRTELVDSLDKNLIRCFETEYTQYFEASCDIKVKKLFFYALVNELGKDRPATKFDLDLLILQVGNALVKSLLSHGDFHKANHIGRFICQFSKMKRLYHHRDRIRYGYTLAEYLVGIGAPQASDDIDKAGLLETSQHIMKDVIDAFDTLKIAFETLHSEDLVGLIHLLHKQGNYKELERVLSPLWSSRGNAQATFGLNPQKVIEIGTCLVHAQCAQKKWHAAKTTAYQLYYNLQRSHGRLDSETLAVSRLLASIYASIASSGELQYASYAMDVHQDVLLEIDSPSEVVYNGYARHGYKRQFLREQAWAHLGLLKSMQLQLNGLQQNDLVKRQRIYNDLYNSLNKDFIFDAGTEDLHTFSSWQYASPKAWKFERPDVQKTIDIGFGLDTLEIAQREWVLASRIFTN